MIQRSLNACLLAKPLDKLGIGAEFCAHDLDCHGALEVHVQGPVDDTHAARPDNLLDAIVLDELADHGTLA